MGQKDATVAPFSAVRCVCEVEDAGLLWFTKCLHDVQHHS